MIICDYSGIAISGMFSQRTDDVNEDFLRHTILNSLRMYNTRYKDKYGEMVLACDGGSWRKNVFTEYKASRKTSREASSLDWESIWKSINLIREEIRENLPYKVVQVPGAEADDVIATLVESTQEFGCNEKVMIVSADKDFEQLQKYSNVSQFSPMTKKLITNKSPRKYLMEHVLRGDSGDGVPNVLSDDDTFVDPNKRQPPLRAKILTNWIDNYSKLEDIMEPQIYKNYLRNRTCIDLSYIPEEVSASIMKCYNEQPSIGNSKVFNYLIQKRCKMLVGCAQEFFSKSK